MSFSSLQSINAFNMAYAFALINGSDALHILERDGEIVDTICYGADESLRDWSDHIPYRQVFRWDQDKFDQGLLPFDYEDRSTNNSYNDYKEHFIWNVDGLIDEVKVSTFKSLIENSMLYDQLRHVHTVKLEHLLSIADPLISSVWSCENGEQTVEIDVDLIMEMVEKKDFPKAILSPEVWDKLNAEQARLYHNGRIAQIYSEGAQGTVSKPISIILNKVDSTQDANVDISDGFHRLAAMTLMNCETVECLASQPSIVKLFMNNIAYDHGFLKCLSKIHGNPVIRYQNMSAGVWAQDTFITSGEIFSLDGSGKQFPKQNLEGAYEIVAPLDIDYDNPEMENSVKELMKLMGIQGKKVLSHTLTQSIIM